MPVYLGYTGPLLSLTYTGMPVYLGYTGPLLSLTLYRHAALPKVIRWYGNIEALLTGFIIQTCQIILF